MLYFTFKHNHNVIYKFTNMRQRVFEDAVKYCQVQKIRLKTVFVLLSTSNKL